MKVKNKPAIFGEQVIMGEKDVPIGEDPWFLPAATSLFVGRQFLLGFMDLPVDRAGFQQLLVRALGDTCAVVQDQDPVGKADGRCPLGDDQGHGLPGELPQGTAEGRVRGVVQG